MSLTKHAGFTVLSARIAAEGGALMRTAHRHEFDYQPRPGYLYVRSRAISSRCNDNFDEFPAPEIKTAFRTFVGKPVFVNHHNDNHRRARGVIKDAVLHEDLNQDGSPDTWVEVLMEVDAIRFPKLAQAILAGEIDRTSMGTDVAYSVCSFCGNKASSPVEYCSHIPKLKGQRIYRRTASGSQEGVLVREICYGLGFFENSLLVEEPADPTAYFLGVDDHSGLIVAASKTAMQVRDTPATSYGLAWDPSIAERPEVKKAKEWTGWDALPTTPVNLSDGPLYATEQTLSSGSINKVVDQGPSVLRPGYDAFVLVDQDGKRIIIDGHHRVGIYSALGLPIPSKILDLRTSKMSAKTDEPPTVSGVGVKAADTGRILLIQRSIKDEKDPAAGTWEIPGGHHEDGDLTSLHAAIREWEEEVGQSFPEGGHVAHTWRSGPYQGHIVVVPSEDVIKLHEGRVTTNPDDPDDDDHEIAAWWHPSDAKGNPVIRKELQAANVFGDIAKAAAVAFAPAGSKTAAALNYNITLGCGDHVRYVGSQPGQVTSGDSWTCKTHGETTVSQVSGSGTTDQGLGWDKQSAKTALNDIPAPKQVDTLREEACPVCGESDSYDGAKCQVCNFIAPPDEFMEPNLDKAKQTDLRQDKGDGNDKGGDLACDNCGATFSSTGAAPAKPKVSVIMDRDKAVPDEQEASAVDVAPKAGDPCPDCGEGTLEPVAPASDGTDSLTQDPNAEPAPQMGDPATQFLPAGSAPKDDAGDQDASDGADDQDGEDGDKPDFLKKKKPTAARSGSTHEGEDVMRPALAALVAQQKQIEALKQGLAFIAEVAGVTEHPRITSALKATAVDDNPAFGGGWALDKPVEAAPEAPVESTQEAATPQAKDSVETEGDSPLTDVSPAATTSVDGTGVVLPVQAPATQEVTAPVAGTDDLGKGAPGQAGTNRIETDVRAGTPSDNSAAFRDGGFLGSVGEGRVIAGLRLARLRIQAGIEQGDDLELGQVIAASQVSDETIQTEINTLAKVVTASAAPRQTVARSLVPRSASGAQRTTPSLAGSGTPELQVVGSIADEEFGFE